MATSVRVNLGDRGYTIRIGVEHGPGDAVEALTGRKALVVSDTHVDPLYGDAVERRLTECGLDTRRAVVPAGEASKSLDRARELYSRALSAGLDRRAAIIALGGGMIGDLAGFVAATFLRGIGLVQMPTSLLAMVDSSVGGKTGVNLPEGKNLVGAFYQPLEVITDLAALRTLPEREYVSGLAEVVKYGILWDAALFAKLESETVRLLRRDEGLLEEVVARCCEIKAEIVAVDEKESGVRAILNFGHTLGHALEQVTGYDAWLHGEAVAVGMAFAARVSAAVRGFPSEEAARVESLLRTLGLPTTPDGCGPSLWGALRRAMSADKKTLGGVPRLVLAERLGSVVFGCEVPEDALARAFQALCEEDGCVSSQ